ncbi:MAG: hypothetical protein ACHRHE_12545 [Tepidisphaerales bacterium]
MGLYGTIVLYPTVAAKAAAPAAQKKLGLAVIEAFVRHDLLRAGAVAELSADREPSPVTCEYLSDKPPKGLSWIHFAIAPEQLLPGIGSLVYTDTARGFLGEKDKKKRDLIAIPYVDVTVLSKPLEFHDHDGAVVLGSNVLIEFSYADARLSPIIHTLRDPRHPLLEDLASVLGSKIAWGVVSG